jgi:energy-coupling factor transporter ATP-binding protein EcfA2
MKDVMDAVGITQRRKLLINKLSGGQQKRVSIAMELLAKPNVFFLDEPTSGLDPGLDRKMMAMLRNIADKEGHTIILVTHATNNINNCDYVCFMAPGGYLAYFGRPDETTAYFNLPDFADIYNALEPTDTDPDIPKRAETHFKQSPQYQQYVVQPRSQIALSPQTETRKSKPLQGDPWKQFRLFTTRYLELLKNDRTNLLVLLLQAPIVAIVLMLLIQFLIKPTVFTSQQLPIAAEQVLFIMSFVAVFFGCNNSAREIVKEIQIYQRERMVNLGIIPYLFSKILVLGILCLLQCVILVIAVNAISPFPKAVLLPPPLEIYVSLSLTSLVGLMIGLMISSLATSSDQANSIIPIVLIFQILFSGVVFHLTGSAEVFGGLFAMRWSMIGMGSSVGLTAREMGYNQNDTSSFPYAHDAGHVLGAWFALLVMLTVFGVLTIYFLKRKDRPG